MREAAPLQRVVAVGRARSRRDRLDVVGAVLVVSGVGWFALAGWASGRSPWPIVGLLAASAGSVVGSRLLSTRATWLVPLVVVLVAAVIALRDPAAVWGSHPLSGPFGYANAKAAFFAQAAVAGLMLSAATPNAALRSAGWTAALAFAAVPLASASWAAGVLLVGLSGSALLAAAGGWIRKAILLDGALLALALVVSTMLGATTRAEIGGISGPAASALSERRLVLWSDAVEIMLDRPVLGVGPGGFRAVSPTALADPDAAWVHNEFLQAGAEGGVLGAVILVSMFAWAFVRLGAVSRPGVLTALSAAALAILGVHACVDYVLHFPAVPIVAAALTGVGMVSVGEPT